MSDKDIQKSSSFRENNNNNNNSNNNNNNSNPLESSKDEDTGHNNNNSDNSRTEENNASDPNNVEGKIEDVVKLNVGGNVYITSRSTLTKTEGNMLSVMFLGICERCYTHKDYIQIEEGLGYPFELLHDKKELYYIILYIPLYYCSYCWLL